MKERNNNSNIEGVKETMEIFFSKIPIHRWQYFHKKSLENFILFLPKIKSHSEKNEIIKGIEMYLEVVNSDFCDIDNMSIAKELFDQYIYPIARKYEWRQGFIPISSKKGLFFLVPLLLFFLVLFYLANNYLFYIFFFFLLFIY